MAKFYSSELNINIIEMGCAFFRSEYEARKLLEKYNKQVYASVKSVKHTFHFMRYWDSSENEILTINALNQFQLHVEL